MAEFIDLYPAPLKFIEYKYANERHAMSKACDHVWKSHDPAWDGSEGGETVTICVHCRRYWEDVDHDEELK